MTQPEAVAPDQWGEIERLANAADATLPGEWHSSAWFARHLDPEDAAFIAAANPATVLELVAAARSVGTDGRNATGSEPQNHPHPGRGEGEPVAWRYRYPNDEAWQLTQDHDQAFKNTGEVEPLGVIPFAAPTTYGKGEREELIGEVLDAAASYLRKQYHGSYGLDHPVDRVRILQALQPIGGRRG